MYENKHTVHSEYSCKVYWKGNAACGFDEDPDRVELTPANSRWPSLDFALPRQQYELEKVERLMLDAYQAGQRQNRKAIADQLKALIAF